MKDLDTIVKTVVEGLRSIAQGVEKIAEKLEESAPTRQTKPKPKRKARVKPKKAPAKKSVKKKPPATAADTVLRIINRSKKGVGTATLVEKTGYDRKKIANIIFRLKKDGKIKNVKRGVFIKA